MRDLPQDALLRMFEEASPEERAKLVERLVEEHQDGTVTLPGGPECRLNLRGVSLKGIRLHGACLSAADLREADLEAAFLAGADLGRCLLDRARLVKADLVGASLVGAEMSETDLRSSLLEEADLTGATMRFAHFEDAVLEGANLSTTDAWGASFENADMRGANLAGGRFGDARFHAAELSGADFRGAVLTKSDLSQARMQNADFRGAALGHADLTGAIMAGAKLQAQDLNTCVLTDVHLSGARFDKTQLSRDQFGQTLGEEREADFAAAAKSYLALERNFIDLGETDSASWAYRRRRRMQKLDVRGQMRRAARERDAIGALGSGLRYAGDLVAEWVCDYGESVWRVLASVVAVFVLFAVLYGLTGSVVRVHDGLRGVTRRPVDLIIFSLLAMTTSGSPAVDLVPRNEYVHLLTGVQAGIGIFLTGLLGFVAGNRIRR